MCTLSTGIAYEIKEEQQYLHSPTRLTYANPPSETSVEEERNGDGGKLVDLDEGAEGERGRGA